MSEDLFGAAFTDFSNHLSRIADALERIVAKLEDDPDRYDYEYFGQIGSTEKARADGWKLYRVDQDGSTLWRRPRQHDAEQASYEDFCQSQREYETALSEREQDYYDPNEPPPDDYIPF